MVRRNNVCLHRGDVRISQGGSSRVRCHQSIGPFFYGIRKDGRDVFAGHLTIVPFSSRLKFIHFCMTVFVRAHDVMAAYCLAMAEAHVRIPLGACLESGEGRVVRGKEYSNEQVF